MAKNKDYRDILKGILNDHPEIAAINVEYKKVERLTLGEQPTPASAFPVQGEYIPTPPQDTGFTTPSGLKPIVNPPVSPELIAKLRGGATVETINVLNAPPENK